MSAGTAAPTGARATITAARSPGHTSRLVVSIKNCQLPLDFFAATFLTFNRGVLLTHGTDGFEFLLARLANIFIDGHGVHLVSKSIEVILPPKFNP